VSDHSHDAELFRHKNKEEMKKHPEVGGGRGAGAAARAGSDPAMAPGSPAALRSCRDGSGRRAHT
jgi:hypothetical protein